jgi:transcriptional regulator with XRE-family HTH domain
MKVVRKLRTDRGWSQRKLANKARTSQITISEIELGLRDPHPTTLRKIAEALGVSVAELSAEEPAASENPDELPLEHAQQRDSAVKTFVEEPAAPIASAELLLSNARQRNSAVINALRTYFRDLSLRWKEPPNKPSTYQIRDALDLLQHLTDQGAFKGYLTPGEENEMDSLFNAAHKLRLIAEELAEENEAAWLQDMIEEVFESISM